jgi:hypothetical protein
MATRQEGKSSPQQQQTTQALDVFLHDMTIYLWAKLQKNNRLRGMIDRFLSSFFLFFALFNESNQPTTVFFDYLCSRIKIT